MRVGAVLLAAGASRRFGGPSPKQFLRVKGRPLFWFSLRAFLKVPSVKEIVLVLPKKTTLRLSHSRVRTVIGGRFRGESVKNGVQALSKNADVILIHDTARPLVTREIIERVARAAFQKGAALAAWPLPDTLKSADGENRVKKTIPRKNLWLAQTPQGFRWNVAQACLLNPSRAATDDAELAERKGHRVHLVEGAPANMKVTTSRDMDICEALLR